MVKSRAAKAAGLHYLEHESMELKTGDKTWKVYGSPVSLRFSECSNGTSDFAQATPRYLPGSFQYEYEDIAGAQGEIPRSPPANFRLIFNDKAIYKRIPRDTEILLTHTPAFGVLDMTRGGTSAGCPELLKTLKELGQCRVHVFGHIHEAHGAIVHEGGGVSVNAAMSGGYGQAVIVDLKHASS
jgi:hypothetical protein